MCKEEKKDGPVDTAVKLYDSGGSYSHKYEKKILKKNRHTDLLYTSCSDGGGVVV